MDNDELALQYSPSRWSRRFSDPQHVINHHVQLVSKASEETKQSVPCKTGVRYGDRAGQLLDMFGGDALPNSAPVFVYVHGGYWQQLDKDISSYCVKPLYEVGIKVAVVGYDLAPKVKLHTIAEEIEEAATYLLNYAKDVGSRCVVFGGHSAGAHLSALLLRGDWWHALSQHLKHLVKGFVLLSGVYDLTPIVHTYVNHALGLAQADARLLSPLYREKSESPSNLPRVLVAVAEHDSPEFLKQSERYTEKLQQENYSAEFVIVPAVDHFDLVEKLSDKNYILTQMIIKFVNH